MYILIKDDNLSGFSDKKELGYENYEISMEKYLECLDKQKEKYILVWDKKEEKIKFIKLNQFEFISENGDIKKDYKAEEEYSKNLILKLKKEKIQLKKDILDFEEFEEDTTYLKEQLKQKEAEIKEMEEKIKSSEK